MTKRPTYGRGLGYTKVPRRMVDPREVERVMMRVPIASSATKGVVYDPDVIPAAERKRLRKQAKRLANSRAMLGGGDL